MTYLKDKIDYSIELFYKLNNLYKVYFANMKFNFFKAKTALGYL